MKYLDYIRDNPEGYWFKRKLYGWGWTPAKWQGWVLTLIYIALVLFFGLSVNETMPTRDILLTDLLPIILSTIIFLIITYKTGQKPCWQWGKDLDKDLKN